MRIARWRRWLTDDEEVRLWFEDLERGSSLTAEQHIRVLYRYCEDQGTTPPDLVALGQKDLRALENQVLGFVGRLEKQGHAPDYIKNYVKAIKSYLGHHHIVFGRKVRIKGAGSTPTLEDERVPMRPELRQIFNNATLRGRVVASLIGLAGLRPEVMGNHRATDGLRLKDLPDLKIEGKTVRFERTPAMVVVRASLSKAGHRYFTFLPQEGCDYLQGYLEGRLADGELLGPESPIVKVKPGYEEMLRKQERSPEGFIVSRNISREVRLAMRPRFTWRPYVLRAYFDTQLLLAESAGKVPHSYRVFWMGHKGDMEARYTTNKGKLAPAMVEDMRRCAAAAAAFLESVERGPAEDPIVQTGALVLQAIGYSQQEVAGLDLEKRTKDEVVSLLQQRVAARIAVGPAASTAPSLTPPHAAPAPSGAVGRRQRVIDMVGLDEALATGWLVKMSLPDGRIVVELQS